MATDSDISAIDRCDNVLTKEDVKCVIAKSLGPKVKIHKYYIEKYSDKNLGLMGAHRNLVVEVSRDGSKDKETHTYFYKTLPYDMKGQAKFLEDSGLFRREASFFNQIMPELMKNSADKSWAPQCFLARDDVVVFENLKLKNYTLRGRFLDVPSIKAALTSLAKLHGASMLAEKHLGLTFITIFPEKMYEILFTLDGPFHEWYRSAIVIATKVAEKLGLNHEVVPKVCNMILEKVTPSKTRRNVINHGDTWSNNLMFNGSKCAMVDYQTIRYAPPMVDVAQAIYFNAKKEIRDKFEKQFLECYHETLSDVLHTGGMESPSFQDIMEEYQEMKVVGMVSISMYFPVNKVSEERMEEVLKSSEGFEDLFCRDRLSTVLEVMEKDEEYRELIFSVVRELVEMSETLFK